MKRTGYLHGEEAKSEKTNNLSTAESHYVVQGWGGKKGESVLLDES